MKLKTPIKAMRSYCKTCGEGTYKDIKVCERDFCPAYAYRMGKRPTEEALIAWEQARSDYLENPYPLDELI